MVTDQETAIVELLAAIVRGAPLNFDVIHGFDPAALCEGAEYHGVLPLVADRLCSRPGVPLPLQTLLRTRARDAALTDMIQEAELKRFLAAVDAAALKAVIIKGGHLAYVHYPRAELRPRIDTDILIAASARPAFHELLTRLGYASSSKVSGELVTGQSFYVKRLDDVPVHAFDVHWKVASPLVFAQVLLYEELAASSVPLPGLGPKARGPSDVHALLIACVHRVAHHADSIRLQWLYDIDLISRSLDHEDWKQFVALAIDRKVAAVCRRSLERTITLFNSSLPEDVLHRLRQAETAATEVTAGYLDARTQAEALVDDLRTLGSWTERIRLVREHVFPPADYMRRVYAPTSSAPLPLLYVWRFIRGAGKWLGR